MRPLVTSVVLSLMATAWCAAAPTSEPAAETLANWPAFRGPSPSGPAPHAGDPLVAFDPARDVRFKVEVPARGQSSPIVFGERIFLTGDGVTATVSCAFCSIHAVLTAPNRILAFDRATGKLLWNMALDAPDELPMPGDAEFEDKLVDTGMAAPTPVTDGQRVYAFFGSSVLGCVDFNGKQVWAQRLVPGKPRNSYGLAASPVLYDDLVIQVVDLGKEAKEGLSFIVAVRAKDGVEVWRQDRPVRSAWTTPLLAHGADGDTLITTAEPLVIAYDPKTGQERWRAGTVPAAGAEESEGGAAEEEDAPVLSGDVAASPVVCGNAVIVPSGESGELLAIKLGGKGDVTKTHVLWHKKLPMPDVASAVCDGRRYFHISHSGDLYAVDPATGEQAFKAVMKGRFWASPVVVKNRIYAINYDGVVYVIATDGTGLSPKSLAAPAGKVLAGGGSDDNITASPAILDGRIYVRSTRSLLCIGRP